MIIQQNKTNKQKKQTTNVTKKANSSPIFSKREELQRLQPPLVVAEGYDLTLTVEKAAKFMVSFYISRYVNCGR